MNSSRDVNDIIKQNIILLTLQMEVIMRFSKEVEWNLFKNYLMNIKDWDIFQAAIKLKEFRNICKIIGV
jgi:hypothetical protein